jgi:hypothetical protein
MESQRGWRWGRLLSRRGVVVGVAGVVVLALVGLFALRGSPGTTAGGPNGAALTAGGPSATATADGLTLSLRVSPSPYFLSDLVAARMTLANGSDRAYRLQGVPEMNDCDQALGVAAGERRHAGRAGLPWQRRGMELLGRCAWLRHRVGAVSGGIVLTPRPPLLARRGE